MLAVGGGNLSSSMTRKAATAAKTAMASSTVKVVLSPLSSCPYQSGMPAILDNENIMHYVSSIGHFPVSSLVTEGS